MEQGRQGGGQDSAYEMRVLEGAPWSPYCLYLPGEWERDWLKVAKLLFTSRCETQMSAPGPASEPCLVERYLVGGENGKIAFWEVFENS